MSIQECQAVADWLTTKSKVIKVNYRWEITNFTSILTRGETTWSSVLRVSGTEKYWKLYMVTDRDGFLCVEVRQCQGKGNVSSIYHTNMPNVVYSEIYSETPAAFNVCICDANDTKVRGVEYTEVFRRFVRVGENLRTRLIRLDVVLGNPDRYSPGGKLTVLCTLHYLEPKTYAADQLKEPLPVVPPREIASSFMGKVLAEGRFSDVVVVAEEREFPVHRAILAQRSDVFRAMFDVDMTEKQNKRVVIEDLSADAVSDLLTFIYTDSAPNVNMLAMELLAAAEKYNVPRLKAVCEAELAKSLNIDNVIDRLLESETYRADQLKAAALHWISKHAPDVVETTSWKSLCEEHPALVAVVCEQFASYIKHLKCSVSTEN